MKGLVDRLGLRSPFRLRLIGNEACIEIRKWKLEFLKTRNEYRYEPRQR